MEDLKFRYFDEEYHFFIYSDDFKFDSNLKRLECFFAKANMYAKQVEQYTGYLDKNGVEVYVNDIIKPRDGILGTVKFWPEYGIYGLEHFSYGRVFDYTKPRGSIGSSTQYRPYTWKSYGRIEVVGDIHLNSDLLRRP